VIIISTFEFIRKPWEGKELEIDRIKADHLNNVIVSLSSLSDHDLPEELEQTIFANGEIQYKKIRRDKIEVLTRAYKNPLDTFL